MKTDELYCLISLVVLPLVMIHGVYPMVLKLLDKNSLADFVNRYDSPAWLITIVNFLYKVQSLFWTERELCTVDSLIVYPIKSIGKGLQVSSWKVGEFGLMYDRQYVFAAYNDKRQKLIPITLREYDRLIDVEYEMEDNYFVVKYDRGKSFKLPMKMDSSELESLSQSVVDVQLWCIPVKSHDVSSLFPQDFITKLDLPANTKLFYTEEGHPVKTAAPPNLPNTVNGSKYRSATFQDYFPLMILSRIDLLNMNAKLAENNYGYFKVTDFTFRPNIIVKGDMAPHDEDTWYKFNLKSKQQNQIHSFTTTTKCGRCMVPNIDYHKDFRIDKAAPVTKTLSKYRRVDPGDKFLSFFGVFAVQHETNYTITIGDSIDVIQRRVNRYKRPVE